MLTEYEKGIFKHKKIILIVLFVSIALYFWPASLYGDSDYILLLGNSMLPTIEPGSLVIIKSQPFYYNGDIIGFTNSKGTHIVHRIIEINDGVYITQGDNNSFEDAPITQDEIVGKAELVIPYMGYMGLFLQTPIGIAMMAVMIIVGMLPKSKSKSKSESNVKKSNSINPAKIVLVGLIANGIHYVAEQIAIAMNMKITIPILLNFEPSFASTVLFAMWTMILILLHLVANKAQSTNAKGLNPLKLLVISSGVLIIVLKIMSMIPILVNVVSYF